MQFNSASYRDPAGSVFHHDGRVFRTINKDYAAEIYEVLNHPVVMQLRDEGKIVGYKFVSDEHDWPEGVPEKCQHVLEHELVDFISYPYEWSFSALKEACLLQIDLHLKLLEADLTLIDASAYNFQFLNSKPFLIDVLSIRKYEEGKYWPAYRQFLDQFLCPLLLEHYTSVPFTKMLRSDLEGVSVESLTQLLPLRAKLNPVIQLMVLSSSRLKDNGKERKSLEKQRPLTKTAFIMMLKSLRRLCQKTSLKLTRSVWSDYYSENTYSDTDTQLKAKFISNALQQCKSKSVIDFGCNDGKFSEIALKNGAERVIGFELDRIALEKSYFRASEQDLDFLPLHVDIANPSPSQGWRGTERVNLMDRLSPDFVLGLAVIHHLVIGRNLTLNDVVDTFLQLGTSGVIEFVPKSDPMVQQMLKWRDDIFEDYDLQFLKELISRRASISNEEVLPNGRTLIFYAS